MKAFEHVKDARGDLDAISKISDCALIAMKQYRPDIKTREELEDLVDLRTVYKIVDVAAGIKVKQDSEEPVKEQAEKSNTWDDFDLAKLEAEAFTLGIWKDFEDLESSLSMPEITAVIGAKREQDYQEKKFLAALQGVDLDEQTGNSKKNAWEEMKARVFSGKKGADPNDITSFQGPNATKAGFGIGLGLGYEDMTKKE